MASDRSQTEETAELADALFNFMPIVVEHVNQRLTDYGLTNTDHWALRSIDGPMPMKALAQCMKFDPSYVTMVADRLEKLGLVERQAHPTDRRIKNLTLTSKGERLKETLPDTLWDSPNTFSALTKAERRQFMSLLEKLVASNSEPADESDPAAEA